MQANKVQKVVAPVKPEGGLKYSTSKPTKTNHLSKDQRTRRWQLWEEIEAAIKVGRIDCDLKEKVDASDARILTAIQTLIETC